MLKRRNESDWSRFSNALTGQKATPEADEDGEAPQGDSAQGSPDGDGAVADSPSSPQPMRDVNLGVGRPTGSPGFARSGQPETLISERSFFDGRLKTEESIRIRGKVQGEVQSEASVLIDAQATVTATVIATSVTVAGQMHGPIVSSGRVELLSTARCTGEITAGTLVIHEGAVFDGNLRMTSRGDELSAVEVTTTR